MSVKSVSFHSVIPIDIICEAASYLSLNDLRNCMRVCHEWNKIFSSDRVWKLIANQRGIVNIVHPHLTILQRIVNWIKKPLSNEYKTLVKQDIIFIEDQISKIWPEEFIKLFGTKWISKLPKLDLSLEDLEFKGYPFPVFKKEHFIAPIVSVNYTQQIGPILPYLLLRIVNNETKEEYYDAITVFTHNKMRIFENRKAAMDQRIIAPFNKCFPENFDRLKRLVDHQPVGMWNDSIYRGVPIEEKRQLESGKSVLSLF
jgi:hypothetical protein